MSQNNIYNTLGEEGYSGQNATRDSDNSSNSPSSPSSDSSQAPYSEDTVGVNVAYEAKVRAKKFTYKNLEGELELIPSRKCFDILAGSTIHISGLGKYLSGFYHVISRSISISGGGAMSIKLGVIRSKFGDSLKGEAPLPETQTVDLIGDTDSAGNSTNVSDGAIDSGSIPSDETYKDGTPVSPSSSGGNDRVSFDY